MSTAGTAIQIYNKITRYSFVLPLCCLLMTVGTIVLSFGLMERQMVIAWISGLFVLGNLVVLVFWDRMQDRLSNQMLEVIRSTSFTG